MARALFAGRVTEATPAQVAVSGGGLGFGVVDPVDGDTGWKRAGKGSRWRREVPDTTRERARDYAVTSYRMNPMCTAIIDTMTSFCVGDKGVKPLVTNPEVGKVVDEFWNDPANRLADIQEVSLRSHLLLGEKLYELMVGQSSGVVRFSPVEPAAIQAVVPYRGNPLWPGWVHLPADDTGEPRRWRAVHADEETGLRDGKCFFWAPWRTLDTDTRGVPFIHPILDWLDSYDNVLSNLIDRTALARYAAYEVVLKGQNADVGKYITDRGSRQLPPSGSIEVHNESVEWKPLTVSSGAFEDVKANSAVLTSIAAGAGLSRTWLADPEDANRATSLTMAEPVRRRIGGVQKVWLAQQSELCRFAVDRAVASGRLREATVEATDPRTGETVKVPASQTVTVVGPEIAAADAQLTTAVLLNLATGLEKLVSIEVLSPEAARLAARKGWEDYMGVPYRAELDSAEANPDDMATHIEEQQTPAAKRRRGDQQQSGTVVPWPTAA